MQRLPAPIGSIRPRVSRIQPAGGWRFSVEPERGRRRGEEPYSRTATTPDGGIAKGSAEIRRPSRPCLRSVASDVRPRGIRAPRAAYLSVREPEDWSLVALRHQAGGVSRRVQYRDRQGAVRTRHAPTLSVWTTGLCMENSRPIAWRPSSGCRHGHLPDFSTHARGPSSSVLRVASAQAGGKLGRYLPIPGSGRGTRAVHTSGRSARATRRCTTWCTVKTSSQARFDELNLTAP